MDSGLGGDQVDNEAHMVEEQVMVSYNDTLEDEQLVEIISLEDVSRHQTRGDAWIVIYDKVKFL